MRCCGGSLSSSPCFPEASRGGGGRRRGLPSLISGDDSPCTAEETGTGDIPSNRALTDRSAIATAIVPPRSLAAAHLLRGQMHKHCLSHLLRGRLIATTENGLPKCVDLFLPDFGKLQGLCH
jgi:hypothetical protein